MSSFFLLTWGVQILCLFSQNQTPRSDSANLEPSEPIFCPQILGAQVPNRTGVSAWGAGAPKELCGLIRVDGQAERFLGARGAADAAQQTGVAILPTRPSRAKSAPRSLRRVLLMPQVNAGSLYRGGKRD